jgi:hypothetical protein
MTRGISELEERLRQRFASDAIAAPPPPASLADLARTRAQVPSGPSRGVNRHLMLVGATAVVAVAVAVAIGWLLTSRDTRVQLADGVVPDRPGAVVELPSSGWKPGDGGRAMALTGTIAEDERGCITVASSEDPSTVSSFGFGLLWPVGYTARRDDNGQVSILDEAGRVILREGDAFEVGGGPGPIVSAGESTCLQTATETFAMESIPVKVERP